MQLIYHFSTALEGNLAHYAGDDKADLNITYLKQKLNIKNLCLMNQVHGDNVKRVYKRGTAHECDAIITNEKNLALCVLTADCIPLLLYDKKTQAIASVHAGRAGVYKQIAKKTIQKMQREFSSNPKDIIAFIGNHIQQCCYEISGDVLNEAKQKFSLFVKNNHLDIHGILLNQLQDLGVKVIDKSHCTCCDERYFSYRRDKKAGRMGGFIMLRDKL